jgi:hypothetical protein
MAPAYLLRDILYPDALKRMRADNPIKAVEPAKKPE